MDISEAMACQMKAERLKRAEILKAEDKREAAFRDAEAREREAEAEAKETELVSNAIASSGNQAINYFIAQEYTKAVGKFADSPNAKTILMPFEATQLIGSLGGIGELVRDTFGDGRADERGTVDTGTPMPSSREREPAQRRAAPPSVPPSGTERG